MRRDRTDALASENSYPLSKSAALVAAGIGAVGLGREALLAASPCGGCDLCAHRDGSAGHVALSCGAGSAFDRGVLQLAGIITIVLKLRGAQKQFPGQMWALWWQRRPLFRVQNTVISPAGAALGMTTGRARVRVTPGPQATLEQRLGMLEDSYTNHHDGGQSPPMMKGACGCLWGRVPVRETSSERSLLVWRSHPDS